MSLPAMMACKVASLKADDMKVVSVMVSNDRTFIAKIHMLAMNSLSTEVIKLLCPAFCPPWNILGGINWSEFFRGCGLLMCGVCLCSYHHGVGDEAAGAS
jgi:hypothetical protein